MDFLKEKLATNTMVPDSLRSFKYEFATLTMGGRDFMCGKSDIHRISRQGRAGSYHHLSSYHDCRISLT